MEFVRLPTNEKNINEQKNIAGTIPKEKSEHVCPILDKTVDVDMRKRCWKFMTGATCRRGELCEKMHRSPWEDRVPCKDGSNCFRGKNRCWFWHTAGQKTYFPEEDETKIVNKYDNIIEYIINKADELERENYEDKQSLNNGKSMETLLQRIQTHLDSILKVCNSYEEISEMQRTFTEKEELVTIDHLNEITSRLFKLKIQVRNSGNDRAKMLLDELHREVGEKVIDQLASGNLSCQ